jgi:putative membrane protein
VGFGFGDGDTAVFWVMSIISGVIGLAITIGIIILIILGIRWLIRADQRSRYEGAAPPPSREDPLEIIRQRYARGEIDEEEFKRRRATLGG